MKPDEQKLIQRIAILEKQFSLLQDVYYRTHFIDKDVFSNPVFIMSRFKLRDLTVDPGIGEKGELCSVNGILKICTVSSTTSPTWVIVGTQT